MSEEEKELMKKTVEQLKLKLDYMGVEYDKTTTDKQSLAVEILRQKNLLAIAPLHLNIMAASPLDALKPTRLTTFNTQAPPRPDDPATTTGSILLLI